MIIKSNLSSTSYLFDLIFITHMTISYFSLLSRDQVYTPIPADFTRLTSFGDLRSYLVPKDQDGFKYNLISEKVKGNSYIVEYIATAPEKEGLPVRHVKTLFGLRPAESVVGLTAQSTEEKFKDSKDIFEDAVDSFTFSDRDE